VHDYSSDHAEGAPTTACSRPLDAFGPRCVCSSFSNAAGVVEPVGNVARAVATNAR
jgi:hypothetical protein